MTLWADQIPQRPKLRAKPLPKMTRWPTSVSRPPLQAVSPPTPIGRTVSRWPGLALAAALAAAGCSASEGASEQRASNAQAGPTGLFTTLPILWQEADDIREHLHGGAPVHWAKRALQNQGEVRALNTLSADPPPLAGLALVIMAQPRVLSPSENVALDDWVRRGGRVLLFADPMLTGNSRFSLGDKRRPQDVVLLSPILARWGLRLEFDDAQPVGQRDIAVPGGSLPVNLPGRLALVGAARKCRILAGGIAAQCRIGKGAALIIADAALFEPALGNEAQRRGTLLDTLIAIARTT